MVSFPQVSPPKPCIRLSSPPIRATCPAYLILLYFITPTILGEGHRSLGSSLCSFLHSPVTSYRLGKSHGNLPNVYYIINNSKLRQQYKRKALLLFHGNDGRMSAQQCPVIRKFRTLFLKNVKRVTYKCSDLKLSLNSKLCSNYCPRWIGNKSLRCRGVAHTVSDTDCLDDS